MSIPVFLNGVCHQMEEGSTLAMLVAEHLSELHSGLLDGSIVAADGRGIAALPEAHLTPGAIFMVRRSARARPDALPD